MLYKINYIFIYYLLQTTEPPIQQEDTTIYCRDRQSILAYDKFALHSCANCYAFLFQNNKELTAHEGRLFSVHGHVLTYIPADRHNLTHRDAICSTLSPEECQMWQSCCQAAEDCCQSTAYEQQAYDDSHLKEICPRTWDGIGCWGDTPASSMVSIRCPSFISNVMPNSKIFQ